MREYKFKAWDKRNKKWVEAGQSLLGYLIAWISDYKFEILGRGDYEIVQYTGLKDRNDKEIYEGDIVIPQTFTNAKYRVYWSQERLQWSIINTSNVSKESGRALINNSTLYEVIGNIYENPDMIDKRRSKG